MPPQRRQTDARRAAATASGVGGLFRGLGDLIELLSELAEQGEQGGTATSEFEVKGSAGKLRGVYGISVRTGLGGAPQVERFGNIRATDDGPVVDEVREPLVDLFDEGAEVLLIAELPGVAEGEIQVDVQGDIVAITTSGERKFAKELLLPAAVEPTSLQRTYRNGVLELRLAKSTD